MPLDCKDVADSEFVVPLVILRRIVHLDPDAVAAESVHCVELALQAPGRRTLHPGRCVDGSVDRLDESKPNEALRHDCFPGIV